MVEHNKQIRSKQWIFTFYVILKVDYSKFLRKHMFIITHLPSNWTWQANMTLLLLLLYSFIISFITIEICIWMNFYLILEPLKDQVKCIVENNNEYQFWRIIQYIWYYKNRQKYGRYLNEMQFAFTISLHLRYKYGCMIKRYFVRWWWVIQIPTQFL